MEDMDLKQEQRYCSRIGAALFFVLIWTAAWQCFRTFYDECNKNHLFFS